jgi:hypothetical protein
MSSPILLPSGVPVGEIPDPVGLLRSAGVLMTPEQERLDAIERARWVLVRIDGTGERWRCSRCNGKHVHFTVMCVPRPFRGLQEGLRAYWRHTTVADGDLTPEQQRARDTIARRLGFGAALPALAARHPETARALATTERDLDLGAWVLGTVEPITDAEARRLAATINARAHRPVIRA